MEAGQHTSCMDLYGMIVGGARDASFLVDFLPAYLFPQDDRTVAEWVITGKSLGGHAAWHVLANDPRIKIGVPFIGMPDYSRLLASRTRTIVRAQRTALRSGKPQGACRPHRSGQYGV